MGIVADTVDRLREARPIGEARTLIALAAVTALGAVLRFATLDEQSFWLDELVTVSILKESFGEMLAEIPKSEATPYLYYVVAWPWTQIFGFGEVGLRSLSAVFGAATVPVAFGAGAALVSRRTGLIAAALVSVNPFLVWYAQEARSYALLALLTALTVLFFGRALRSEKGSVAGWAITASLALATHYFALFLVVPEAAWLLARLRPRRRVCVASLLPAAVLLAHTPLMLEQRDNAEAVAGSRLVSRAAGIAKDLVVGYSFPAEVAGSLAAAALLVVGLILLCTRTPLAERRGALIAGVLGATTVIAPVVLALVGIDFVIARNAILAVVPSVVCVAAGYAASRLGLVAATALCVLSVVIVLSASFDARYGRTDWRGAAERLSPAALDRAIVVTPFMSRTLWRPYLPALQEPVGDRVRLGEIVVVGLATEGGFSGGAVEPPATEPVTPPRGFRLSSVKRAPTVVVVRYRAPAPTVVSTEALAHLRLSSQQPGVLLQPAAR